jgi:30S ribosomal protein 3
MKVFVLKFLWLQKSIAVSLDQKFADNSTTPLTEFFFWPQHDAWEEMKLFLESKPWVNPDEAVVLLNQITEVINEWQEKSEFYAKDLNMLRIKFPSCIFVGYD